MAIIKKDTRKLVAPATKPIRGGPIKKPKKPMVDTAAKATPGDNTFDLPAALYTNGITEETPAPTSKKPAIAVTKFGKSTANNKPQAIKTPLSCKVRFNPNLPVNQSATNLPEAMVAINAV